ncbi:transposase [Vibrio breoganii]|uniref:Transposase n=5 Tax=Vibrio breoganii TaxID=553239 RepID=A0AAP8MU46_9VIBR|nr:IS1634 family transposase [Vibrio breoganii]NMO75444.1 IS1634 family transposase [Vibrio breoganii]NMR71984.1 IS1634 family transposase [Vibrio breoganii]PMF97321.1 transposase [Vibrio breoganii]PML86037.1 transposase [Vibrio breoganii]PMP07661.1 transposase [Vibrio breoganii]
MSSPQPVIKRLDHLGLIAAFCHEIDLPGLIDRIIPKYSEHNVSHGDAVLAMILNGLGFHSRTLHMFSDFFETKPISKLLAKDIEAYHLTDDVLGRTLDALFEADVSILYQVIAEHTVEKLGLKTDSVHLDITSFHVDGEYAQSEEDDINSIQLVKGYSRDHRPELNQVVLELICENQAGLPVYMQALSGNTNDAKAFAEVTKRHIHCLKAAQNSRYFIADAALYTSDSICSLDEQKQKFITRVPMTIKMAKQALLALLPEQLEPICNGYSGHWIESDYGNVKQRWLLVNSEQATKREEATFYKNLDKNLTKELKSLAQLAKKQFACAIDAQKAMSEFQSQCQLLSFDQSEIRQVPEFAGRGRPKKDEDPTGYHYKVEANPFTDLEKVKLAKLKVGMFILATNDTESTDLDMVALLEHYKSQQKVERGFRFLKSPEFLTSSIFLKKPQRVEALLMVMTLSLMVYAGLEHKIRKELAVTEEFFPSMVKNKTTSKPTARWVFLKFEGVDTLEFGDQWFITGIQDHQRRLLQLLGKLYEAIYS